MIWRLQATVLVGLILTLTLDAIPTYGQQVQRPVLRDWLNYVKTCSEKYGIDPNVALAVAEVESSGQGQRFRFGPIGKGTYYGPYGIKKCFLSKWDIADPYVNTEIGIKALTRYRDLRKSLRKYNAEFNEAYYRRIVYLAQQNRRQGVFK